MNHTITGRYGRFGGTYLPEMLMEPIAELCRAWDSAKSDPVFCLDLERRLHSYGGRATPLTEVQRFSQQVGAERVFLKREDLLHTGAHKLNNALGQCLLAQRMGKRRIIAETGAGLHGVATAASCAHLGLECVVYMGQTDMERQAPNVQRMRLMGARVLAVEQGKATLKEAVNAALRDWSATFADTHYCLGSALGPHPYPEIVRTLQSVIGKEARAQILKAAGRLPDLVVACVGGGSNAIGIFSAFLEDAAVQLVGVEAAGAGRIRDGSPGVLHGCYTYLLQDFFGQTGPTHSISAGLDYPAIGPEHAQLHTTGRAQYVTVDDEGALAGFRMLASCEGVLPALESSHALGYLMQGAQGGRVVLVNLSGRGDKDLGQVGEVPR